MSSITFPSKDAAPSILLAAAQAALDRLDAMGTARARRQGILLSAAAISFHRMNHQLALAGGRPPARLASTPARRPLRSRRDLPERLASLRRCATEAAARLARALSSSERVLTSRAEKFRSRTTPRPAKVSHAQLRT